MTSTAMATAQVRGAMDGNPESRLGSCSKLLHSETWMKGWQWIGVIVCAISYYAGITRALFLISPPDVLKTEPVVERSNLQLIHYLAKVGMPLASLMVVTFSVIIPMFKFITTFLVMHPPSSVSRDQHAKFCKLLCALSPYQMSDIFLVMLILAYLNTGFSAGGHGEGYECTLCSGFESFFVYCFVSIVVAQILEVEHAEALEEAVDPQSSRSQPAQVGNEEAPSSPAPSSPQDEVSERPGIYAILRSAAVVPTVHLQSRAHVMLRAGDLVEVTEVVFNKDEMRLRGRIVNPPGWISILDLDDGHRWAERQEDAPDVEENLVRLLVFVFLWASCIFTLLVLPAPPMSLQARSGGVGGVIVYRQEPTLSRLFDALWMQSPLFSGLMVLVLMVTPALFLCVAFARIMLFRHFFDPIWARRLWYLEQLLKPWVMGDVAAVSITSLFLSIQEPSTDFVFLCVRLAQPPLGFLACLGQGVACWGMRWCALPLRPGREAAANSSPQSVRPMDEAAESKAPLLLVAFDTAAKYCQPAPKQGGAPPWTFSWLACLVWRELFVWLFWFTIFWRLGPSEPPFVHSLKDLNVVLRGEVPRVNMLLMEHIPGSIGDCWAVKQHHLHLAEDYCKPVPMVPVHVPFEDLSARVVFIDGISSLRIMELQVLPENRLVLEDAGPFAASFDNGQRWAIKIKGEFSDLKIWAEATKGNEDLVDGYICCHRPYHVGLQLSMLCRDPEGFAGNLTVDNFQIDPVSLNTRWADGTPAEGEQSTFEIEMGGNDPDLIHQAIKKHLESAIVAKTGGATPVKAGLPPFALSSLLNKLLRFNGGTHCPRADGA